MNNPLFSVLIANYNNAKYFEECFRSLQGQTYQNFEVIILDDGSTDESLSVIQMLIRDDIRFSFYKNETNKGVGYTKNKLVTLAQGDICGFVDGDDVLALNAIEIMVKMHLDYPKASIINSNLYFCDESLQVLKKSNVSKIDSNIDDFFNKNYDIAHFAAFKKALYFKTEGINPYFRLAEDQDLYLKLYEVGEHQIVEDALYFYRSNPNSLMHVNKTEKASLLHWYVILRAAERRNLDIDEIIHQNFIARHELDRIRKSSWAKLGSKLGLFKAYNSLFNR